MQRSVVGKTGVENIGLWNKGWSKDTWSMWRLPWRKPLPQAGLDMGNGRVMEAEDVLEGHFRRVTARRQSATHNASVQVGDNLIAAITVLAPNLAPLTEMAEQVSGAVPLVQPEAHFRENLHEALERTHRQHAAQRALGTRSAPRAKPAKPLGWWIVLLGVLATITVVWGWRTRQASAAAA